MKILTKDNILYIIIVLLVISIISIIFINSRSISKLERVNLENNSNDIINHLDIVADSNDEGKYIIFALNYLKGKYNKDTFTDDEVINTINNIFNVKYDIYKLESISITNEMSKVGIIKDTNGYVINNTLTRKDISEKKLVKYSIKKISKKSNDKYVIEYNKLIVDNPYNMFNYYNEIDINKAKDIKEYLDGNTNYNKTKDIINETDISKYGYKDGSIKVTYKIVDNKLLVDSIK